MKTKRIVALALAAALTVGGVAPTLAAPADYKLDEQQASETVNKYNKALAEQKKVMDKAIEDEKKAEAEHKDAIDARKKAQDKVAVKEGDLEKAKVAVDLQDKAIADKEKEVENNKKEYNNEKVAFTKKQGRAPLESNEHYEAAIKVANAKYVALFNAGKAALKKDDATWAEVVDSDKDIRDAFTVYDNLRKDAKEYKEKLAGLAQKNYDLAQELDALQKAKQALLDVQFDKQDEYNEAKKAYEAAKVAEAKAFVAEEEAENAVVKEKSKYDRLATVGSKLTLRYINKEIVPKLAKLSADDVVAYILGSLALEDGWFSEDVYAAAGIDKKVVDTYRSVLGDQGEMEAPGDKKPGDKKPEDKKPEEEKPEVKKPEEKKPEVKKPEEKKPEAKKKAAPKTGDISLLAYAGTAVMAAGAFVASKKRK